MEQLNHQQKEIIEELKELGVEPNELENEIKKN